MTVRRVWEIRVKNGDECIASVRVLGYTGIDICPVYERCGDSEPTLKWGGEIKLNPEWNGEINIGKPSSRELVWHKTRDVLPSTYGKYLICTDITQWPIIAEATIELNGNGCNTVAWSRSIKHTRERIPTHNVHWWARIPLPVDKEWERMGRHGL